MNKFYIVVRARQATAERIAPPTRFDTLQEALSAAESLARTNQSEEYVVLESSHLVKAAPTPVQIVEIPYKGF